MPRTAGRRRWQSSLYARAALFLILGSASLVGAVAALSSMMVDESVDRLLQERIDLARTVGVLLEHRLASDMHRLGETVGPLLETPPAAGPGEAARMALAREYRSTMFTEGAFVLDPEGRLLSAVPATSDAVEEAVDLPALAAEAQARGAFVSSPLVRLGVGPRPVLVLLEPLRASNGARLGFAGGILAPASTNVLDALSQARSNAHTELDLVDERGVVVASTDRRTLFRSGDHGSVLTRAIAQGRDLRGQCHSCHVPAGGRSPLRDTDIMAFSPLPTLELGVAVHQPEDEALAPAFALRRRLIGLGVSFVALFVLFAGLSVRSVVHPITRLTRAVGEQEAEGGRLHLPSFGHDEVGLLAGTLERWRGGLMDSLAALERQEKALQREIEATRRHLEALQDVAAQAMLGEDAQAIVEHGLDRMLDLLGMRAGALRIQHDDRLLLARRGLEPGDAERFLGRCEARMAKAEPHASPLGFGICQHGRLELGEDGGADARRFLTVLGAFHRVPQGLEITCVLADEDERPAVEERWVQSLVHHIGISVTNRLLREKDLERQKLQEEYLHRVLTAQEDERRRVARELHDTVSQDLAALRLEIERLGNRAEDEAVRTKLHDLEGRAHAMLLAVRRTLLDLRLSVLENMGFLPALQWHLERMERDQGVRGTLGVDGDERPLEYELSVTLFRIFQEALQNAVQHAGATHVFVSVLFTDERVELTVEDDGEGFEPEAVRRRHPEEQGRGLGLLGMEERAKLLGGRVEISSRPGDGTLVHVIVPVPAVPRVAAPRRENA